MAKKRGATVPVRLESNLLDIVDDEVKRLKAAAPKVRTTRADAIRSLVQQYTYNFQPDDPQITYEQFLQQASVFKLKSLEQQSLGEIVAARSAFLRAAASELLALSVLDSPPDATIIQHLIEVVESVKKGTGYKSLPDARRGAKLLSTAGSA